ncbi:hypothetical protein SYN63AY4M2_06910 [Synechococcus sp. 63AY4M2]|uniref:hypothetical protein n=1 Tax=Synechococcus sp. 63AY4M2 TaxID=1353266 RepID=UPI000C4C1232|nr:hypothetical protein [Synechococcus sp. 63AY4M2]PIK86194.1 hypothetical protein SYN63AY4M2_06910 [Synechococcus sp. 63AY4M2]
MSPIPKILAILVMRGSLPVVSMLKSLPARQLFSLGILLLSAGGLVCLSPRLSSALANEQAVPEAELALQPLLPPGSRILRSRRLSDTEAEIWVESRGGSSPVVMRLNASGRWEQDMNATLARGASQMQALARQQTVNLPAGFGQTAPDQPPPPVPSLLQATQAASSLIPPVDREQETQRALSGAGRADPFVPQNVRAPEPTLNLPPLPPPPELPPPGNGGEVPVAVTTPLPTPTRDPAAFARSVQVSGMIQIGGESFALVSGPGVIPSVVQAGQNYQTARVAGVSVPERRVVLSEGGETVVKTMQDTTVIVGAP